MHSSVFLEKSANLESFAQDVLQPSHITTNNCSSVFESAKEHLQEKFRSDIVHIEQV